VVGEERTAASFTSAARTDDKIFGPFDRCTMDSKNTLIGHRLTKKIKNVMR